MIRAVPNSRGRAIVASTDRYATEVGVEVFRDGGNAADAVVAVAFALAVVNPEAGNLGGGGFLVHRAGSGELAALDFRSTAPALASAEMLRCSEPETPHGAARPTEVGPLAAAVPGSVRGLWEAHRELGRRPWASLVEPAIRLARGFEVTGRFTASFEPHIVEALRRFESSSSIFLPRPGLRPPEPGDRFVQADLCGVLERIRDRGADGFYLGETADRIVDSLGSLGGVITREDLAAYRSAWREPLRFRYRGHTIVGMPPSSSGGVTLAATAQILAPHSLDRLPWYGADHIHLLTEAWRRAYADRNQYLADPDFVDVPVDELISPDYGGWRALGIDPGSATRSASVGPGVETYRDYVAGRSGDGPLSPLGRVPPIASPGPASVEGTHTTHVSVVDLDGNAASLTTTLNTWYGSKVVARGTGVMMNNEMDDFTVHPGEPNHFGLVQGEANSIEPGKRMLSAMTPTLVLRPGAPESKDALLLVVGTPGGGTIITSVFQVVSNLVDFGVGLSAAVRAPRVHHQHLPDRIEYEPGALAEPVVQDLKARSHHVIEADEAWGDVQAILRHRDGSLEGASDPRRGGATLGL